MKRGFFLLAFCWIVLFSQAQVTVSVPSVQAKVGDLVEVPVRLDGVEQGTPIQAFEFVISSSSTDLQFRGGRFNGTLVDRGGWTYSCNTAISKCLGFSGPDQVLRTSGVLVHLQFAVISAGPNIEYQLANFRLNGGNPSHTPLVPAFSVATSGGAQNSPPPAPFLTGPTTTFVGGHPDEESVMLLWDPVFDTDGDAITYSVLFGLTPSMLDPLIALPAGTETQMALNVRQMGGIMAVALSGLGRNVAVGQSVELFAQVEAFDGGLSSFSNVWGFTAIRAEIVGVEGELPDQEFSVRSFPNPASDTVTLAWQNGPAETGNVLIADALGRIVFSGAPDSSYALAESILRLDTSKWSSGVYVYRVFVSGPAGQRVMVGSFVKTDE